MVELTEREKKIVLIKYIIHGTSPYDTTPVPQRVQMLEAAVKTLGIKYDDVEMQDLGEAILEIQKDSNDSLQGFLQNNPDLVKQALKRLGQGNDRFSFNQ
jgi:hypothetical protein